MIENLLLADALALDGKAAPPKEAAPPKIEPKEPEPLSHYYLKREGKMFYYLVVSYLSFISLTMVTVGFCIYCPIELNNQ